MSHDISKLLNTAWQAANAAGELIRDHWHQAKTIDYKGPIDLVTSTDQGAERTIVEILQREFPDHAILAEEETRLAGGLNGYRWIVDPLDGTTNFAHGYPQVSVSIALEFRRRDHFRTGLRSAATRVLQSSEGRRRDFERRARTDLRRTRIGQGPPRHRLSLRPARKRGFLFELLQSVSHPFQGIRRAGSAALDLCYVAAGRLDGFWELKLNPWDVAAGALIVAEAGGSISNFSGAEFSIHGNETLASNGVIHNEMVSVLRTVATRVD